MRRSKGGSIAIAVLLLLSFLSLGISRVHADGDGEGNSAPAGWNTATGQIDQPPADPAPEAQPAAASGEGGGGTSYEDHPEYNDQYGAGSPSGPVASSAAAAAPAPMGAGPGPGDEAYTGSESPPAAPDASPAAAGGGSGSTYDDRPEYNDQYGAGLPDAPQTDCQKDVTLCVQPPAPMGAGPGPGDEAYTGTDSPPVAIGNADAVPAGGHQTMSNIPGWVPGDSDCGAQCQAILNAPPVDYPCDEQCQAITDSVITTHEDGSQTRNDGSDASVPLTLKEGDPINLDTVIANGQRAQSTANYGDNNCMDVQCDQYGPIGNADAIPAGGLQTMSNIPGLNDDGCWGCNTNYSKITPITCMDSGGICIAVKGSGSGSDKSGIPACPYSWCQGPTMTSNNPADQGPTYEINHGQCEGGTFLCPNSRVQGTPPACEATDQGCRDSGKLGNPGPCGSGDPFCPDLTRNDASGRLPVTTDITDNKLQKLANDAEKRDPKGFAVLQREIDKGNLDGGRGGHYLKDELSNVYESRAYSEARIYTIDTPDGTVIIAKSVKDKSQDQTIAALKRVYG